MLVGLKLVVCRLDGSRFVHSILQFDDHQRESVDIENDVGTLGDVVLDDGELVHHQKFVVGNLIIVNQPHLIPYNSFPFPVLHIHPFGEVLMKSLVIDVEVGTLRP